MTENNPQRHHFQKISNDLIAQIQKHPTLLGSNRHQKIRINSWLDKLEEFTSNRLWRRNRNNYLRLLYVMLEMEIISEPFLSLAPPGLPKLQRHEINCCLLEMDGKLAKRFGKANKCMATELWTRLENSNLATNTKPDLIDTFFSNSSQLNEGINALSPISLNLSSNTHARNKSLLPQSRIQDRDSKSKNKQSNCTEPPYSRIMQQQHRVNYFKNNRENEGDTAVLPNDGSLSTFLAKIHSFLIRNRSSLQHDRQFQAIIQQLEIMVSSHVQQVHEETQSDPNYQTMMIKDTNQSQYSDVEINEGISPQKIKDLLYDTFGSNSQYESAYGSVTPKESHRKMKLSIFADFRSK